MFMLTLAAKMVEHFRFVLFEKTLISTSPPCPTLQFVSVRGKKLSQSKVTFMPNLSLIAWCYINGTVKLTQKVLQLNWQNLKCPSFIYLPCLDAKLIHLPKMKLKGALIYVQTTKPKHFVNKWTLQCKDMSRKFHCQHDIYSINRWLSVSSNLFWG